MADHDHSLWLRLLYVDGLGNAGYRALLTRFGLPENIFAQSAATLAEVVGPAVAARILDHTHVDDIARTLEWLAAPGNALVTLADAAYPQVLLTTADPPVLLFAKGRLELANRPALAMVGSRNASAQGLEHARAFARALSEAGLTIVSGLALGIDAAAHEGGLKGRGSSIAVIGTGLDRIYPAANKALAHALAENGLVLSEFPLGTPPIAANFPRRNRVIAGLSKGVLVVEAAIQSGSLITARLAGEEGREVFAIPGSIASPMSKGCHKLIKEGAKLVDSAQDILEELRLAVPASPEQTTPTDAQENVDDPETQRLLAALGHDPVAIDTLVTRSGLAAERVLALATQLELEGRIAALPGGRLQRVA